MLGMNEDDLPPDLKAEYEAAQREQKEIILALQRLERRSEENNRAPDLISTYEESERLFDRKKQLEEREAANERKMASIKIQYFQLKLDEFRTLRQRHPDDEGIDRLEEHLREQIQNLKSKI